MKEYIKPEIEIITINNEEKLLLSGTGIEIIIPWN